MVLTWLGNYLFTYLFGVQLDWFVAGIRGKVTFEPLFWNCAFPFACHDRRHALPVTASQRG